MKLQIDTEKKTIKIEESVKLKDLVRTLSAMFPEFSWYDFTLEVGPIITWVEPISFQPILPFTPIVPYPAQPYDPQQPLTAPWITYCDGSPTLSNGVFNVDVS